MTNRHTMEKIHMAPRDAKKAAREYLKEQAKIIQRYGKAPKLSGDEYQKAVKDTARVFSSLSAATERSRCGPQ